MIPPDTYRTLAGPAEATLEVKKSRFLAFAFPVTGEAAVADRLADLEAAHPKARHHCFAYRVAGDGAVVERSSDAREPTGTAGPPILRALQARGLVNVLVVVVRYFGGIKLGTGGLLRAYHAVAAQALEAGAVATGRHTRTVRITYPYDRTRVIQAILRREEATVTGETFGDQVTQEITCRRSRADVILSALRAAGATVSAPPPDGDHA